jgi:hypothetical protein
VDSSDNDKNNVGTLSLSYSVTIGDNLHKRIDKHLNLLKNLEDENYTKQQWLMAALKEKLEKDENLSDIPKARHLRVQVDRNTHKKLESMVNLIKNFRRSYSKKQLLVEAICEKLDREEEKAKKLLLDLKELQKQKN